MPSETKRRTVRPVSTLQVHVLRGPWHAAGRDLPDRSMSTLPCGWHPIYWPLAAAEAQPVSYIRCFERGRVTRANTNPSLSEQRMDNRAI